jgi:hypothetical protein
MSFQLRDNLHWCDCLGRVVFLDTEADRYFCLPKAVNDAFLRLAARKAQSGDAERLQLLVSRGLLRKAGPRACIRPPPLIDPPTRDFLDEAPRARLLRIFQALASELSAAWALRTKSFQSVINDTRIRRRTKGTAGFERHPAIEEIVSAAAIASFITRSHDRCLVRALAVYSMCRKSGARPKLVFGVIAHPFTAHSWVQLGSAVLVGRYEQARLYTPILVLE